MTETTEPAKSRRQQNDTPRSHRIYCIRGILLFLFLVELAVGFWYANEEQNEHKPSTQWVDTFVEQKRKFLMHQKENNASSYVEQTQQPKNNEMEVDKFVTKKFTRLQAKNDLCDENSNAFDFPEYGCSVNGMNSRVHCQFQSLRLNTSKIISRARGGEPLQSVLGQDEKAEYLAYQPGAFSVVEERPLQNVKGQKFYHYISDVLGSLHVNTLSEKIEPCSTIWKGTTLFLTRYEYVNLYHTMTDWWNTFFSIPAKKGTDVLDLPINIILLDAHPQGNLDVVWAKLLGGQVAYARHLNDELICFETARFVPAGYTSPLFPGLTRCPDSGRGSDFVDFFLSTYNLKDVHRIPGRGTYGSSVGSSNLPR
jgi:hypothetical protein